jgi:mannose-1-phosphate guanylyltransferase
LDLFGIDVAILAGGLGTRLAGVLGDVPKVLAPIGGRPFLAHLLDRLAAAGARRVVLGLGHLADRVTAWLAAHPPEGIAVVPLIEPRPLGTAGGLRFLRRELTSEPVLVMNGDSVVETDLGEFVAEHRRMESAVSMLCVEVAEAGRYGRVELGAGGWVRRFVEKDPLATGPALINGGIYAFGQAALNRLAESSGPSLERDFLPSLTPTGLYGAVRRARFIDIGTPESLAAAADFFAAGARSVETKRP